VLDEEEEARKQLGLLKSDEASIAREKVEVQAIITRFEDERRRKAEEKLAEMVRLAAISLEKRRLEEEERVARAKEERRLEKARKRDKRGRYITYWLSNSDYVDENFDETVTCLALGGDATIMIFEGGGLMWTRGLNKKLYNKLNGRQKSLPCAEYVSIGSQGRYYVRFKDGTSEWIGCDGMSRVLKESNHKVKSIAFGEHWDSYFIVYTYGGYCYVNVPRSLDKLMDSRNKTDIDCVSLGPDGEYFISAKNGKGWWGGMLEKNLKLVAKVKDRVQFIDFGDDDAFICRYT